MIKFQTMPKTKDAWDYFLIYTLLNDDEDEREIINTKIKELFPAEHIGPTRTSKSIWKITTKATIEDITAKLEPIFDENARVLLFQAQSFKFT